MAVSSLPQDAAPLSEPGWRRARASSATVQGHQLTGIAANGISGEYPVMRHANNLESVLTYEGTSEVHQLVIGQALTGQSAFR